MTSLSGLSSGLDTASIISQLMQIERIPQDRLVTRRSEERSAQTELKGIRSAVSSLGDFASDMRRSTEWLKLTATSSNESVTATATSGDVSGSFSFSVAALAKTHTVYSNNIYEDLTASSGGDGSVFSYRDTAALGIESLSGNDLPVGDVEFSVTQETGAAKVLGSAIPTIPVTIDSTNDRLGLEVDGVAYEVTLDHGDYDSEQALANAITSAFGSDQDLAGVLKVKVEDDDTFSISTIAEGSAHSLQLTGGNALDSLGLTAGAVGVGTDGIVSVNGQTTIISDTTSDVIILATTAGPGGPTIEMTLDGGLREGTADVEEIELGDGSLSKIVSTINSASGLNYSAAAINTGNGYRLQLMSKESGVDAVIDADLDSIAGVDGFTTLTLGSDAELTVEGTNPYTITSASNDFSGVLPGLDITVTEVSEDPVTVSISRDHESVADQVSDLVDRVNSLIERISGSTANIPGETPGVLHGNRSARTASDQLLNALIRPVGESSFGSIGSIGIAMKSDGTLEFDRTEFLKALKDDPDELTRLFAQETGSDDKNGVLDRIVQMADGASSYGEGYLYTAAESAGSRIEYFSDQIDAYEIRLELREQTIRRTYANLEVLLGEMQRQSSALSSQLGSL